MSDRTTINQTFIGERVADATRTRFKGELAGAHLNDFLATMSVAIRKPRGAIRFERDREGHVWHEIGRIRIYPCSQDRVEVIPRQGLTDYEMDALRGAIFEAFLPDRRTWSIHTVGKQRIPVYECDIYLPN